MMFLSSKSVGGSWKINHIFCDSFCGSAEESLLYGKQDEKRVLITYQQR